MAFRSPRDLEVGYWVNQQDPNGHLSFGSNFTQVVYYTSNRRLASFTVFCENFMNLPPTNGLLRKGGEHIESGNVLIIKHPLRDVCPHNQAPAEGRASHWNVTHADIACAGKLLQWALCTKQYWI
ncbi:hypothetical protein M405DRAFT_937425 [Rhizopogon salebrosus TDB-379]|nr:hypothetical protein M405DRAFT_937425 [Rhizopogon salebrosus TDB-379]